MTTLSSHHVIVYQNTQLIYDSPFYIRCITCDPVIRKGFRTQEDAEAYAEDHRKAHPYHMNNETFSQRIGVIERAIIGMDPEQLEIAYNLVADAHIAAQESLEA